MLTLLARLAVGLSIVLVAPASAQLSAQQVKPTAARRLDGDWNGSLTISLMKLRLAFHFHTDPGGVTGTLDSIDQQANGIAITKVAQDGDKVEIEVATIKANFHGALDRSGQTLVGEWRQGAMALPLALTRRPAGQAQPVLRRPQAPAKPYPYRVDELTFPGLAAGVTLAGTLTLPEGKGPFPAVVLVAGSGPNTRNEPIAGHQLFLVMADYFTRHGIAVLRYDKRGTGGSSGDYSKSTSYDFTDDAQAAMTYLRSHVGIDANHVGMIGHSEGGLIVPMVAARDPSTAFIVMMAGPGVNGAEVWLEQFKLILAAAGMPPDKIAIAAAQRQKMVDVIRGESDPDKAAVRLRAVMREQTRDATSAQIDGVVAQINNKWFREFFAYEPVPVLRKVKCPVLVLGGSKDLQVPTAQSFPPIRAALAANSDVEIDELTGLNHLFQTAKTGGIGEYGQIEETIAAIAMETMTRWVLEHSRAR